MDGGPLCNNWLQLCGVAPVVRHALVFGAGVIVGILGGALLRFADLTPEHIDLLGFPGEIMLRLLKMLVLPLVAGSMVAGEWLPPHALSVCRPLGSTGLACMSMTTYPTNPPCTYCLTETGTRKIGTAPCASQ